MLKDALARIKMRIAVVMLIVTLCVPNIWSDIVSSSGETGNVLVVSSYPPDSKRVTDFLKEIDDADKTKKYGYNFIIENMNCGTFLDYKQWNPSLDKILKKHEKDKLNGIILLGQEAWATFLCREKKCDVPFYGCFASDNGVFLPHSDAELKDYNPKSIDMIALADSLGHAGGRFNHFDIAENVRMTKLLYPDTKEFALLTDCTYGGVSMQALFIKVMKEQFPSYKYVLLDGRTKSVDELKNMVDSLGEKSAIFIGTWRVDNQGTFTLHDTLLKMFSSRKDIPIISVSGVGVGSVAIGGFFPDFSGNVDLILDDIHNYENGRIGGSRIALNKNQYCFDEEMMQKYGIRQFQLPVDSKIISNKDAALQKYRLYIIVLIVFAVIFLATLILAVTMYVKSRKANELLCVQQAKLRKQTEELLEAKKEAEKSDKLKSAFLANMSHEIRTPLNAIVGFTELIKDAQDDKEKEEYWNIISSNNELLLRLIGDILDLSKIEAGMIDLNPRMFDMTELIDSLYASIKQRPISPGVALIHECEYKHCYVVLDKNRVSQILTNFITNAIKFTVKGHIKFGYEYVDNGIRLYCEDTGIGISKEKVDNVFKRFYKLNDFAQGTGLGMAICKAIIDDMHGKISVDSTEGKGSLFWAWIPVKADVQK